MENCSFYPKNQAARAQLSRHQKPQEVPKEWVRGTTGHGSFIHVSQSPQHLACISLSRMSQYSLSLTFSMSTGDLLLLQHGEGLSLKPVKASSTPLATRAVWQPAWCWAGQRAHSCKSQMVVSESNSRLLPTCFEIQSITHHDRCLWT